MDIRWSFGSDLVDIKQQLGGLWTVLICTSYITAQANVHIFGIYLRTLVCKLARYRNFSLNGVDFRRFNYINEAQGVCGGQ